MKNIVKEIQNIVFGNSKDIDRKLVEMWIKDKKEPMSRIRDFEAFQGYYMSEESFAIEWMAKGYSLPEYVKNHLCGKSILLDIKNTYLFWSYKIDEKNVAIFLH